MEHGRGAATPACARARFIKERPILKVSLQSAHHVEGDETTVFSIELHIDNVGDKPTTIKNIHAMITDEKQESWYFIYFDDFKLFNLNPRSSAKFFQAYTALDSYDRDMKMFVVIDHTHGYIEKKFDSFYSPIILVDDNDEP